MICIASVTGIITGAHYYYYLSDSYISVCGSVYGQLTYIHISASQGLLTEADGELISLLIVVSIHLEPVWRLKVPLVIVAITLSPMYIYISIYIYFYSTYYRQGIIPASITSSHTHTSCPFYSLLI